MIHLVDTASDERVLGDFSLVIRGKRNEGKYYEE